MIKLKFIRILYTVMYDGEIVSYNMPEFKIKGGINGDIPVRDLTAIIKPSDYWCGFYIDKKYLDKTHPYHCSTPPTEYENDFRFGYQYSTSQLIILWLDEEHVKDAEIKLAIC